MVSSDGFRNNAGCHLHHLPEPVAERLHSEVFRREEMDVAPQGRKRQGEKAESCCGDAGRNRAETVQGDVS
jgi:hypothetical protein